jgi:RND family efflux transporter MFP subunit
MKRLFVLAISAVLLIFLAVYGAHRWREARQNAQRAQNSRREVTVSASTVRRVQILPYTAVVGEIVPAQGTTLSLQSSGIIRRIAFRSGEPVRDGQLLVRIDAGALPGQLQEAQANAALARENYYRAQKVHAIRGMSTAALDKAKYEAMASAARVTALKERLAESTLRAPFSGVLGLRTVYRGEYLRAGSPVVELIEPHRLYVDFFVPQSATARVSAGTDLTFTVSDGDTKRYPARILALNTQIDRSSRALAVRARVLGGHHFVRPGMFVLVQLPIATVHQRLVVPRVAVTYHSYGEFVYVLQHRTNGLWIAHERIIHTGRIQGSDIEVRGGLTAGEMIVTAGQVKLHDGEAVRINNAVHLG